MRSKWDWFLFAQILAIGSISLLVIFSVNRSLAANQALFWLIGIGALFTFANFDYRNWQRLAIPIYTISIIALSSLFFLAEPVRGSVRWIDLGFFRFQASELAKVAAILLLALFYKGRPANSLKNLLLGLVIILPAALLVLSEPDIGNSITFFAIWFGVSAVAGFKVKHIAALVVTAVIFIIISFELLAPYQKARIESFINPEADPLGTGYNIIQAKIATGSGKLFGAGLGRGSQSQLNFLPEAESDFIFASIAEQLGLFGAGLLIGLYVWMVTRIIGAVKNSDRFSGLLAAGIISFLLVQLTVNVGMNLGLLPVTGITLPLVSSGGSSLISTLFLLGLVFSINKYNLY